MGAYSTGLQRRLALSRADLRVLAGGGGHTPMGPDGGQPWRAALSVALVCACIIGLALMLALGCATRPCENDPYASPHCPVDTARAPDFTVQPDMTVPADLCPMVVYEVCEPPTAECFPCPNDAAKFCRVVPCARGDL